MSLVGFKAKNHPQQRIKAAVDDRGLPQEDFEKLNQRFCFTIDAAAAQHNAKLPVFWTVDDNALIQDWSGHSVYCNPPYSDIQPWVEKAWCECTKAKIVMLLPANRTEQSWWQFHVEQYRERCNGRFRVEFLPGRMRFIKPGDASVRPNNRPPFGCCLLIWGHPE